MDDEKKMLAVKFLESYDKTGAADVLELLLHVPLPDATTDGHDLLLSFEEIDDIVRFHPETKKLYEALEHVRHGEAVRVLQKIVSKGPTE